jgi:hyperosmotically inducible protein
MRRFAVLVGLAAVLVLGGCREEGAAEKAGRKLDEAVEELTHPGEGPLEKAGRKTDEALEDAKRAAEKATKGD